jgi:hypothetical protein
MPNLHPVPDPPDALALARAERARRNGARSRGPETAVGKARSSRNALRHGLRAKLTVPAEDAAAFRGMAGRLFAELAPTGELEGFLVADLAAAMWRTGRARRFEADALAGARPDEGKLELALRYQASASRDLFRLLRALQNLRRRPLVEEDAAAPAPDVTDVAELAWGAGAAAPPPPPPPGCLLLRPVERKGPGLWRWHQNEAFPGAEPLPVDADGKVYRLEEGAWVPRPWPHGHANPPRPNEPSQAVDLPEKPPEAPTAPAPPPTPRYDVPPLDAAEPDPPPDSFARLWGLARPVRSGAGAPGGG